MNRLTILAVALAMFSACRNTENQYEPTWESLSGYGQAPDWFRDAKLGLWAHWGPQCQPEDGDWYARGVGTVKSENYYEDGSMQSGSILYVLTLP